MVTIKEIVKSSPFLCHHFSRSQGPYPSAKKPATAFSTWHRTWATPNTSKTSTPTKGTIGIVQWYTESEELADLYYYSIRASIEQTASLLGYQIIRSFNDLTNPSFKLDGIIAVGKFSSGQIAELTNLSSKLIFVDSDTLTEGFSCV